MKICDLVTLFKDRVGKLTCSVVDDILTPYDISYVRYDSSNKNWATFPQENVRVVSGGVETHIFPIDYSVDRTNGTITFSSARTPTDLVKVDYNIYPFSDTELRSIVESSLRQVRVLTFHAIDEDMPHDDFCEAILKKGYTIALRELQLPATKYFAINVGGRSIDKSQQVTQIEALITSNEKELLQDINALRYFNKTNVIS